MIRARITDPRALAARTPAELSMYLRTRGWRLVSRNGTLARWTSPAEEGGEFEILQPLDPASRDYAARMGDAVATLAIAEDRSELDILHAITGVSADVHTIRIFPADEPPGLIGIDDGVTAYESLRNLVIASAYPVFANQHRLVQPARKPQELTRFLRTVRIGPATEGSYTLTVHTPVPPRLTEQASLFDTGADEWQDKPVERRVSLQMYEAVRAACEAAEAALLHANGLDPFTSALGEASVRTSARRSRGWAEAPGIRSNCPWTWRLSAVTSATFRRFASVATTSRSSVRLPLSCVPARRRRTWS